MTVDDLDLVKAANGGDAAAFRTLLDRHYDRIFRLGYRILGDTAASQDLAQDICASLPAKLRGFRGDAQFTTWLYRVVSNAALDRLRRQKSRAKSRDGWGRWAAIAQDEDAQAADERAWLTEAMATLNPELKQTVALVLGEELSHAAAAQALGVSEGTVSWRMSEVKRKLRALATEEGMTR
jgi:RNA polymerase sigma-70 factor (ECF subfamily)